MIASDMRRARVGAPLLAIALLAGCAAVDPAALIPADGPVTVRDVSEKRMTVEADGAAVVVAAPPGLCVSYDDVHVDERAAVIMLTGCGGEPSRLTQMIAVAAAPLAPAGGAQAALDVMAMQLQQEEEGWRDLGFGDASEMLAVTQVDSRDGALFVALDRIGGVGGAFGARCRTLTEINGRLVVLTVAAPPGRPTAAAVLMDQADAMLAAIHAANGAETTPARTAPAPPARRAPAAPVVPERRPVT